MTSHMTTHPNSTLIGSFLTLYLRDIRSKTYKIAQKAQGQEVYRTDAIQDIQTLPKTFIFKALFLTV